MVHGGHGSKTPRALAIALVTLMLTPALPTAAASTPLPPLGMDVAAIRDLQAAGAAPRYASFWVGPWMAQYGWGGLDNALRTAKETGTTPVIYWYYWGDSISNSCVEHGCDGRTREQWFSMTQTLAQKVREHMGGRETLIVLENEFNKQGITGAYAPTFDAYLERVALDLRGVQGVRLILGFGAWGENAWSQFPKSIAQSDYIGFQMMRGQTRHSEAEYRGAAGQVAYFTQFIAQNFNKPSFLYDLALSSYPDAHWEIVQAETLQGVFDNLVQAGQTGLQGVIYRSLRDHWMDPINYFGLAESHWGLKYGDGRAKPAWHVWHARASAPPAPNVPGSFEAEGIPATTGGRQTESGASGGATWNLWTNGELRAPLVTESGLAARVTVVARGDVAAGVLPRMEIRLDGATLQGFDVAPGFASYVVDAALPVGRSTLSVAFTNDALVNGQDRNLVVDVVRVQAVPTNRAPVATFNASGTALDWSFDAGGSSDPDGDALTYAWDLGDGTTATGATVRHAYAQGGTYTVRLAVSDGRLASEATQVVTATRPNAAPTATFSASGADLSWSFDASASSDPDGDALTYAWSMGDGTTLSGVAVSHRYATPGAYAVTLAVSDGKAEATTTRDVAATQPNRAPLATFRVTGANLTWAFDARGSSDPDGDALTYTWDFGDGTTATGATVSRTYDREGNRTVRLVASDGRLTGEAVQQVHAVRPNRAPLATFAASGANLTWAFDARGSSDPDGDALTYAWDFGDGTTATGATVSRTYDREGNRTVRLVVSDGRLTGEAVQQVQAVRPNRAPTASFTASGSGLSWLFDAASSIDPDGDGVTFAWDFGDGASAAGPSARREFAPGTYVVRLTVTDDRGASATTTRTVTAQPLLVRMVEAEAFARKDNGVAFIDGTASSGRAWLLWSNGGMTQGFRAGHGRFVVEVVAKGDYAEAWPVMDVRVDGTRVAGFTVDSATWKTYRVEVPWAGQERAIGVHFMNDAIVNGKDRNLRVDVVRVVPAPMALEAETADRRDLGGFFSDAAASGGRGWTLWTNGQVAHAATIPSGKWRVTVVAAGEEAMGWPTMEVRVDGQLVGTATVGSRTLTAYAFDATVATDGSHTVSVHFTNDWRAPGLDRNLRLDVVRLAPA